jgi:hypothetical protein
LAVPGWGLTMRNVREEKNGRVCAHRRSKDFAQGQES